jgi:hypothetical protein
MANPRYHPDHMCSHIHLIGPFKKLLVGGQFAADANCHFLAVDTWHQFLLCQDTSLAAVVGKMIKCQLWLSGGLMCTVCSVCAMYALKSEWSAQCQSAGYFIFWHGYVLHEGITYKSRIPHTSQMTSRLLRHTAAAMRERNVLCNSYNSRDKPLQLSSCMFCVVVHSYSFENCIAYFHSNKLVYHGTPNTHRCTTHPW